MANNSADLIIQRLRQRIEAMKDGQSKQVIKAFTTIGTILASQIKLNIRKQGLVDTGTLINSVRYD